MEDFLDSFIPDVTLPGAMSVEDAEDLWKELSDRGSTENSLWGDSPADIEKGTPVKGYRVFLENRKTGELRSAIGPTSNWFNSRNAHAFQHIPQYKDTINEDPSGQGFFYEMDKAAAYAALADVYKSFLQKPKKRDEDTDLVIYEVQGEHVNKTGFPSVANGWLMNNMKIEGEAIARIPIKNIPYYEYALLEDRWIDMTKDD